MSASSANSFEALDAHDPNLSRLATNMFQKTSDYLYGELSAIQDHYSLLERMNRAKINKYADIKNIVTNLVTTINDYDAIFKASIEPFFSLIDQIEVNVNKLELAAYKLDSHTISLKNKFKQLERRQVLMVTSDKNMSAFKITCKMKYANFSYINGLRYCEPDTDYYLCWPPTPAGVEVEQNCPDIRLFIPTNLATRRCDSNADWKRNDLNITYTNFSGCFSTEVKELLDMLAGDAPGEKIAIAERTRFMELIGLFLSLASLIISLFIFFHYRSLNNNRVKIHKNLFVASLIQVLLRLIIYIDQAIVRRDDETIIKGIETMAYLCEAFYVLLEYANTSMFMWMFMEGYYMNQVLCSNNAFEVTFRYRWYFTCGWGIPLILTAIWGTITATKLGRGNTCWWGYIMAPCYWIMKGTRLGIILMNFLFLLNIMHVLIIKLKLTHSSEMVKIKKAVRAAFVLLPLLGLTNILNMLSVPLSKNYMFAIWSFLSHFLSSFHGFFISLIYCFLNSEVKTLLKKSYEVYLAKNERQNQHRESLFRFLNYIDRTQRNSNSATHNQNETGIHEEIGMTE